MTIPPHMGGDFPNIPPLEKSRGGMFWRFGQIVGGGCFRIFGHPPPYGGGCRKRPPPKCFWYMGGDVSRGVIFDALGMTSFCPPPIWGGTFSSKCCKLRHFAPQAPKNRNVWRFCQFLTFFMGGFLPKIAKWRIFENVPPHMGGDVPKFSKTSLPISLSDLRWLPWASNFW